MSAHLHALSSYLESTLLQWNCRASTAPHAARAMVEALSRPGNPAAGWSQSVEHLAIARILFRIEGPKPMEAFLNTIYHGRMLATARALAMLDVPIHSSAALLDLGVLRRHCWAYGGVSEDWTLDLDGLCKSPEGIELGVIQALKRTVEFIGPVWGHTQGEGRLTLQGGPAGKDKAAIVEFAGDCLARLATAQGWSRVPACQGAPKT